MSTGGEINFAKTSTGWSPVWCAREQKREVRSEKLEAPAGSKGILQFKGFAGGVPPNTERTTVKPWVGSASWQEVHALSIYYLPAFASFGAAGGGRFSRPGELHGAVESVGLMRRCGVVK